MSFDFSWYIRHLRIVILCQIVAKPHTNCNIISNCYFLFINIYSVKSRKSVLSWDNQPFLAMLYAYCNRKIGAIVVLRLPEPSKKDLDIFFISVYNDLRYILKQTFQPSQL